MPSQSSATLGHACINNSDMMAMLILGSRYLAWTPRVKGNIVALAKHPLKMHDLMCKHASGIHNTQSLTTEQQM